MYVCICRLKICNDYEYEDWTVIWSCSLNLRQLELEIIKDLHCNSIVHYQAQGMYQTLSEISYTLWTSMIKFRTWEVCIKPHQITGIWTELYKLQNVQFRLPLWYINHYKSIIFCIYISISERIHDISSIGQWKERHFNIEDGTAEQMLKRHLIG